MASGVRAALTELAHDLRDHVGLTEAEGALYTDIRASAPRLTHGVELQLKDHVELLAEVERLLAERDEGMHDPTSSPATARPRRASSTGSSATVSAGRTSSTRRTPSTSAARAEPLTHGRASEYQGR